MSDLGPHCLVNVRFVCEKFTVITIFDRSLTAIDFHDYCKNPKNSDTQKFAVINLKFEHGCFTIK